MPLCFDERPMLAPVSANQKKFKKMQKQHSEFALQQISIEAVYTFSNKFGITKLLPWELCTGLNYDNFELFVSVCALSQFILCIC